MWSRHAGSCLRGLLTSSVQTVKPASVLGPNVLLIATSVASRPRAMSTRPIRGMLFRAIERVPAPSDIGLEPGGKIHRTIGRRDADIAEIARAVASRNVHAAAECDRQMRVVAAHAFAFLESLPRRSRRSGILVAEGDVAMDVVADGLDAAGAGGRCAEQVPRDAGQPIGLAVSASEEEYERLLGKIFHRMLVLRSGDRVGLACVVQQCTG